MKDQAYRSYKEYSLDIGDASFTFFTDTGALADSETQETALHRHEFCELFYVTKGEIEIKTSTETYVLTENSAAMIPRGTVHETRCSTSSQRIVISFVLGKNKSKKAKENYFDKFSSMWDRDVIIYESFAGGDAFRRFARYYYGNYAEKHQLILSCLHEIIMLAKEYFSKSAVAKDSELPDSIIYRNYIIADYISSESHPKSLSELSGLLHLGKQQTHRVIKSIYGKTFSQCINEEKMQSAMHMLKNTALSLGEISANLGYKCIHNFHSAFKKHFGTTPGSVRNKYIKTPD